MRNERGQFVRGSIPWNKGLTKATSEKVRIIAQKSSETQKGRHYSPKTEFKKGHNLITPNLSPSQLLAYFLGAFVGDGYLHHRRRAWITGLHVRNYRFARKFYDALKSIHPHPHLYVGNLRGKPIYRVTAYSQKLHGWLRNLTLEEIENILQESNTEVDFLRGFFDAEGSYFVTKDRSYQVHNLTFTNTDLALMKLVHRLLCKHGFTNKIKRVRQSSNFPNSKPYVYRIAFSWGTADKLFSFLQESDSH